MRGAGILLPVFSLPGEELIGTFGKEAFKFLDFLKASGQKYWQILPLNPTMFGDSPYQSSSVFAGNPYFIDYASLVEEGALLKEELPPKNEDNRHVHYGQLFAEKLAVLEKAFVREYPRIPAEIEEYRAENAYWIEDFALFCAIKEKLSYRPLKEWPQEIRLKREEALHKEKTALSQRIEFYIYLQYTFDKQWKKIKEYAKEREIEIIGDMPIYAASDSADFWANGELFLRDEEGNPSLVTGCPPDSYAQDGQLWGNPVYDWEKMRESGYSWFKMRVLRALKLYDKLRIDHFRGFDSFYAILSTEDTARNGKWLPGPGKDFFDSLKYELPQGKIIAEDLGYLTPSVRELLRDTGFPGMKVLQFAFNPYDDNEYLPHNYVKNTVAYTGTHDNDTSLGFYLNAPENEKSFARDYLNIRSESDISECFIRAVLGSVSDTAIIAMQDYLGLSSEGRINTPSTMGENWTFRIEENDLSQENAQRIKGLTTTYRR